MINLVLLWFGVLARLFRTLCGLLCENLALRNHREAIAAMDFFAVPTITFGMIYCFFVISRDRRHILHFNVTKHPTSLWVVQQLREAFPFGSAPRFLIFDRDGSRRLLVNGAIWNLAERGCGS